jgi:hypothetical protein
MHPLTLPVSREVARRRAIAWHRLTSQRIASHRITPHHTAPHRNAFRLSALRLANISRSRNSLNQRTSPQCHLKMGERWPRIHMFTDEGIVSIPSNT